MLVVLVVGQHVVIYFDLKDSDLDLERDVVEEDDDCDHWHLGLDFVEVKHELTQATILLDGIDDELSDLVSGGPEDLMTWTDFGREATGIGGVFVPKVDLEGMIVVLFV